MIRQRPKSLKGSTLLRLRPGHHVNQPPPDVHGLAQGLCEPHEDLRQGQRLRRRELQRRGIPSRANVHDKVRPTWSRWNFKLTIFGASLFALIQSIKIFQLA